MKRETIEQLQTRAKELLDANTVTAERDGVIYRFATPTGDTGVNAYRIPKFQWTGWDSQFHAIVYAKLGDATRAEEEIRSIFANQRESGFIPHVAFWDHAESLPTWARLESKGRFNALKRHRPASTEQIQPPVLAESVRELQQIDPGAAEPFIEPTYRYYRWLAEHRDPDGDGLISVISESETGLDYSPAYDAVNGYRYGDPPIQLHRASRRIRLFNKWLWNFNLKRIFRYSPYHVEDVLVNSIYIRGLQLLAEMADVKRETNVKRETIIADWARSQAKASLQSLIEKSYDQNVGLFWNLSGRDENPVMTKTVGSLMPLIIQGLPQAISDRLVENLIDERSFWTEYPVPSTPLDQREFSPKSLVGGDLRIWRGPLSMNTNWYIANGLRRIGKNNIADQIKDKSQELVSRHGFNEFYNPLTGEPCGADKFGWATLAAIM